MLSNERPVVIYYKVPLHSNGPTHLHANQILAQQEKRVHDYLQPLSRYRILKTFIETGNHFTTRHRWPVLEEAISYCLEQGSHFIIAEIKQLTHNESFVQHLLNLIQHKQPTFEGELVCCDQPHINKNNFANIAEHAKQQKMLHGQLIRAGLHRSMARSGNPRALEVITKINQPKIENAIIFAVLLQPIIMDYEARGLSQRKMVASLNQEGFTAPEGGQWVLSQLQKVLERLKMNQLAFDLDEMLRADKREGISAAQTATNLNQMGKRYLSGEEWTEERVLKVRERTARLQEIIKFYRLALSLAPIIEKYKIDEWDPLTLENELAKYGVEHGKEH